MFTRQPDMYFYIVNKVVKQDLNMTKILHLYHKLWFSNPYIFGTQCREILIFQTFIIWSNTSHCLKCQRSTALEFKDIEIIKSEFVAKTQSLWQRTKGIILVMDLKCKSKPEKSSKFIQTFNSNLSFNRFYRV